MYLIKKAGNNLFKNKGRNLVIFLMLSIVSVSSLTALTIYNVTNEIGAVSKNYYAGEVAIVQSKGVSDESLNIDDYRKFVDSKFLLSYNIYKSIPIHIKGLYLFDSEHLETSNRGENTLSNARIYGLLDEKSKDEFSYGSRIIIEGNFPKSLTGCMISEDLAKQNNLHLGDKIEFVAGREQKINILQIEGLFSDESTEHRQANQRASQLNPRNDVIVKIELFDEYEHAPEGAMIFILKDADDIGAFQEELYMKGLHKESYTVEYDDDRYTKSMAGIYRVSSVVSVLVAGVAFVGICIVFFINLLALRERKYEIGVLRAIGMPNSKVVLLMTGEMLLLALASAVIAVIIGIIINPLIIDYILKLDMNQALPTALRLAVQSINSSFSIITVLELIGMITVLVLFAGSATILSIVRFDPIKILAERN